MRPNTLAIVLAAALCAVTLLAHALPRSQLRGRPEISIGQEVGYFLWMDGSVLHVRWTTNNPYNHVFRGEVTEQVGTLQDLTRVSLEDSDRTTLASAGRLEWNANEHLGLDGFDITLGGPAQVRLFIDNRPADRTAVFLGGRRKNPANGATIELGGR